MAAGSIIVDLLMRTGSFQTDTDRAAKRLAKFEKEVVEAGKRIATGAAAIVAAIGGGMLALEGIAGGIAQYQDIADQIGDSAAEVSKLQLAADQSETAISSVAAASVKLTASLAKTDDEADGVARALAAINIPLAEFKALSPTEQLRRVAQEMARFEDGAGKTAVAVQLFGRAGAELLPFLNDLADAQSRSTGLTDDQIRAADQFTKDLATLRSEVTLLARGTAADLLPPFQALLDYFKEGSTAGTVFTAVGKVLTTVFETLAVLAANVVYVVSQVGNEIGGIAAQVAALFRLDFKGFNAISEAMKADAERARAELAAFERQVLGRFDYSADNQSEAESRRLGLGGRRGTLTAPPLPPKKAEKTEADKYLENLRRQLEAMKELSAVERVLQDIQAGRLGAVTKGQREELLGIAEQIDMRRNEQKEIDSANKAWADLQKAREEAWQREQQARGDLHARAMAFYEATKTAEEQLHDQLAEQDGLLYALGDAYADTYDRAVAAIRRAYKEGSESFRALRAIAQGVGDSFANAFEAAAFEGRRLNEVIQDLASSIARLVFRQAVANPLANAISTALTGYFGDAKPAPAPAYPDPTVSHAAGSKAAGGDVMANRGYWVGEQGPEWFQPRTAGSIVPNGGGGNVNIYNQGADVSTRREPNGDLSVFVKAAADMAYGRVVGDMASGTGRAASALRSRGVNLDGSLRRRT